MSKYPKKIIISGQTHGNEWTGTYVVRHLQTLELDQMFPNLQIKLILSSPASFELRKRYVDQDLNRSFNSKSSSTSTYEVKRAAEIASEINSFGNGDKVFILDLHTTTSDMGSSLVMHNVRPENLSVFSFAKTQQTDLKAYAWIEEKGLNFLNSLSEFGFAVEVGPIANNTLCATVYNKTLQTVISCLTFLNDTEKHQQEINDREEVYMFEKNVDYPRNENGEILAMIAPSFANSNFKTIKPGDSIFQNFDQSEIKENSFAGLTPVFINEAAYYEKNIAFTLTKKTQIKTSV